MATQKSIDDFRRFSETGICDCGQHLDIHRNRESDVRCSMIVVERKNLGEPEMVRSADCVLTKETIHAWHQPRFEPGQRAYA